MICFVGVGMLCCDEIGYGFECVVRVFEFLCFEVGELSDVFCCRFDDINEVIFVCCDVDFFFDWF